MTSFLTDFPMNGWIEVEADAADADPIARLINSHDELTKPAVFELGTSHKLNLASPRNVTALVYG